MIKLMKIKEEFLYLFILFILLLLFMFVTYKANEQIINMSKNTIL